MIRHQEFADTVWYKIEPDKRNPKDIVYNISATTGNDFYNFEKITKETTGMLENLKINFAYQFKVTVRINEISSPPLGSSPSVVTGIMQKQMKRFYTNQFFLQIYIKKIKICLNI